MVGIDEGKGGRCFVEAEPGAVGTVGRYRAFASGTSLFRPLEGGVPSLQPPTNKPTATNHQTIAISLFTPGPVLGYPCWFLSRPAIITSSDSII